MKNKILFAIFLTILSGILLITVASAEVLPNKQGLYYLPNGLTDVRDMIIIGSNIDLISKAESGDVIITSYKMGRSHVASFFQFKATPKITNKTLPEKKGVYYLPDGLTDIRGFKYMGSEIVLLSKAERGDIFITFYERGHSYPQAYVHFKTISGKFNKTLSPQKKGTYYLPDGLTDARDFEILKTEIAITVRAKSGNVYTVFYKKGQSYPTSLAKFQKASTEQIANKSLTKKKGIYYLPNGLTDVRGMEFINTKLAVTSRADLGDIVMTIYNMGESYPTSYALFKAVTVNQIKGKTLANKKGVYYLPDGLTDVRSTMIKGSKAILTSKADLGDVYITFFKIGSSYATGYAHFKVTPPADCFLNY